MKYWIVYLLAIFFLSFLSLHNIVHAEDRNLISETFYDFLYAYPRYIITGSDGNLWITTYSQNRIAKLTLNGQLIQYNLPSTSNGAYDLVSGQDGNVWFTGATGNYIGKISTDGISQLYNLSVDRDPLGITNGPDGNVWFAEYIGNRIGKITPAGQITEYPIIGYGPHDITTGPDGNLWYTVFDTSEIGRITPSGGVDEFNLPHSGSKPESIIKGPDNNLWFTEVGGNRIGKITTTGKITEYTIPTPDSFPQNITLGKDGYMWFTELLGNKIGRVSVTGQFNEFQLANPNGEPWGITLGPDNKIWFTEYGSSKIGSIDTTLIPELTPIPSVTITPTTTPVPTFIPSVIQDFKQTDPSWGNARLGNNSGCGTMYGLGCAVTSVADVFYSYGKTVLANSMSLTPGSLNTWLGSNNGFVACAIIWGKAASSVGLGAPNILFRNGNTSWNTGINAIDAALAQGFLPIIGINTNYGTHFITLSAKLPDVNGKPDYKIVDPALYPFAQNQIGKSGQSLSQAYGGFDKVFETIIYKYNSTPQNSLTIRAHSPVQLLITDPLGNQTGFNTDTQSIQENIPESSYGIEPGIAPVDGSARAGDETKYFQQIDSVDGDYSVDVIGVGNGPYVLDFTKTDESGNTVTSSLTGYAQNSVTETYVVSNTPDATQSDIVAKVVTFETLKSDLKALLLQKQIKNNGIYQSLLVEIQLAQKATQINKQPLGNKLALIALKTFQIEINNQRGKNLTQEGYLQLNNDLKSLVDSLQGTSGGSGGGS